MLPSTLSISSLLRSSSTILKVALPCGILAAVLGWVIATMLKVQEELALMRILLKRSVKGNDEFDVAPQQHSVVDDDSDDDPLPAPSMVSHHSTQGEKRSAASRFARFAMSMRGPTPADDARIEDITDDVASDDMSDGEPIPVPEPRPPESHAAPKPLSSQEQQKKKKKSKNRPSASESSSNIVEEDEGGEEDLPP